MPEVQKPHSEFDIVRKGISEPHRANNRYEYDNALRALRRIEEQLETLRAAILDHVEGRIDLYDLRKRTGINYPVAYPAREREDKGANPDVSEGAVPRPQGPLTSGNPSVGAAPSETSDPARSLDDIDPKELSDGMEATVEPGDAMAEADLDAFDPAKEPTEAELLARRVIAYDRALEAVDPATKPRED